MATMAPPTNTPAPMDAAPVDPAMEKALNQVMQGLGSLYMASHKTDPDSPINDAIMSLQKAVAEVGRNMGAPPQDPSMMAEGMPPMEGDPMAAEAGADPMAAEGAGMAPEEAAMAMGDEMPPPTSIGDAAGQTQMMMQEAAKRRQAGM